MKLTYVFETQPGVFHTNAGSGVWSSVEEILALKRNSCTTLIFNGIKLCIYPGSCEEDVYEKYALLSTIRNLEQYND